VATAASLVNLDSAEHQASLEIVVSLDTVVILVFLVTLEIAVFLVSPVIQELVATAVTLVYLAIQVTQVSAAILVIPVFLDTVDSLERAAIQASLEYRDTVAGPA